jgi:hypothetical protein
VNTQPSYDMALLSGDWADVLGSSEGASLEDELSREVPEQHRLFGVTARAVAVRKLRKEVIYWLPASNTWAWVHLTWRVETEPAFPSNDILDHWDSAVTLLREASRG